MSPVVSFTDFSGGEFGDLGPTGCKDNQWTGNNVMLYKDGSVGPRPGVKVFSPTGGIAGPLWAMRGIGQVGSNDFNMVYGQGQLVKRFNFSGGATITTGTVSITVTNTTQIIQSGPLGGVMPIYGSQVYVMDGTNPPTALGSSPGAYVATLYGVRVVVGNTSANPNRVYYSAAVTTTAVGSATFPATNFFDVGVANWGVTYTDETRQRLTITNQGGEFWGLSGVPGVNDVLRRQPRGDLSPARWYHAVRVGESIWFLPFGEDFPVEYTGATVDKLKYKYLRFTGGDTIDRMAMAIPALDIVAFYEVGGSNRALLRANDAWSYQTFGVTTRFASPWTTGGAYMDYDLPILMSDGGTAAAAPNFYSWQPSLDRPGKTGDTYAQPGDNSTTPLTASMSSRYWFGTNDKDIQVTEVTIDGFTWNTGSASTNHCDVQVRSLFRYGDVPYADSVVQSFDQAASLTTSDRQDCRFRATNPGAPYAQGFQIILSAMRGFAVRRIRVEYVETARR